MNERVQKAHAVYLRETGYKVTLDYGKERSWALWLSYRKPPFTQDDLVFVIRSLLKDIVKKKKFKECLNFYRLVAPDTFEQELENYRAEARGFKRPVETEKDKILKATGRKAEVIPEPKTPKVILGPTEAAWIAKMREAVGK